MKYTNEELIITAQKCRNRAEWIALDGKKQYQIAKHRGLLSKCTAHMADQRTVKVYSDEETITAAKKYKSSSEWKHKDLGSYRRASSRGLMPQCTAHMVRKGGIYDGIYSVYAYEFNDRSVYVGLTCNWDGRHERHRSEGPVFQHGQVLGGIPAPKLLEERISSPYLAQERERFWIEHYRYENWTMLNTARGGSIGNIAVKKWKKQEVLESAHKYKTKSDWYTADRKAYRAAKSNGWFEEATGCMTPTFRITPELIWGIATKYTEVGKFSKENPSCVTVAKRLGIYHEVTAHMTRKIVKGRRKERVKKGRFKWTLDLCKVEAAKFHSRTEWARKSQSSYQAARKMGWLDSCSVF